MTVQTPSSGRAHSLRYACLVLAGFLVGEVLSSCARQRTSAECWQDFEQGPVEARREAALRLSLRADPGTRDGTWARRLLESGDPWLVEFAMTPAVTRLTGEEHQAQHVRRQPPSPERFRQRLFLTRYYVGRGGGLTRQDLRRYFGEEPATGSATPEVRPSR